MDCDGSEAAIAAAAAAVVDFSAFSFAFLSAFSLRFSSLPANHITKNVNLKINVISGIFSLLKTRPILNIPMKHGPMPIPVMCDK